jgi:large subunit ribosomal protein L30
MGKKLRITQIRSAIGREFDQKGTLKALGIRKLNTTVIKNDTPQIRGMIRKISHLLVVEEIDEKESPKEEKEKKVEAGKKGKEKKEKKKEKVKEKKNETS